MNAPNTEPLIEARGIAVRFGNVIALDGLDLVAPAGQVLAILGPNGAGKTTFVRAVATLLRPSTGELRVCGVDAVRDPAAVRRAIGLAGQAAAVEPSLTGRENLELTARLFGHRGKAAARASSIVIEQLSLAEVADRRAAGYSGGQRRRLDLAAGLVGAPRLLLLDEPTTALDPVSRLEVWDAVRTLVAAGTDVLLTTHYLDEADALADRVVVIDRGRAIAAGTLRELKSNAGRDVIELAVTDPARLAGAGAVLERVTAGVARLDPAGHRVSVPTAGGAAELATVIGLLAQAQIAVDEIGVRRPTLDEVFISLTTEKPHSTTGSNRPLEGSSR